MHPLGKKEVKPFLFLNDKILFLENPKEFTQYTIRTNEWVQQSCRMQNQHIKPIVFLYTHNEQYKNKIKRILITYNSMKKLNT